MWKVALFLIFTLIAVPSITYLYDEPLTALQSEIMTVLLWVYGVSAAITFVISSLTDNYSQVDKLWSVIPVPYIWIMAYYSGFEPRLNVMACLVTLWAIRLTYNFGRRGGYSWKFWTGEEDYRWSILRAKPGFGKKWKWSLFNLLFISAYQMALILLMTLPALKAVGSSQPLDWVDYALAALIVLLIVIEFIADQQQFSYQEKKHQLKKEDPVSANIKSGFEERTKLHQVYLDKAINSKDTLRQIFDP